MQPHHNRVPYYPENLDDYAPWVARHGLFAPYGQCQCGCGRPAPLAKTSSKRDGWIRGIPLRYIQNHRPQQSLEQAFWRHVACGSDDECWLWQGAIGNHGYGYLHSGGTSHLAHRVSYLIHYGEMPDELCVLHRCDVRSCVNPAHLFLGDRTENANDKVSKGRQTRGSDFPQSRLTDLDVKAIRALSAKGEGYRRIADRFGVARETIRDIVRRRIWKWVE